MLCFACTCAEEALQQALEERADARAAEAAAFKAKEGLDARATAAEADSRVAQEAAEHAQHEAAQAQEKTRQVHCSCPCCTVCIFHLCLLKWLNTALGLLSHFCDISRHSQLILWGQKSSVVQQGFETHEMQ